MIRDKNIWKPINTIENYIEKFQYLLNQMKGEIFYIEKDSNSNFSIYDDIKNIRFSNKEFVSASLMNETLSIWITLGLIEMKNRIKDKKYTKKELLLNKYKITTKENIKHFIINNFGEKTYPKLLEYINNLDYANENGLEEPSFIEIYTNEKKTYHNLFLASLFEAGMLSKQKLKPGVLDVLKDSWINTNLPFDDKWYEIAKLFCFGKTIPLDFLDKNEYNPNCNLDLNLIMPNNNVLYPIYGKNVNVEIYNLASFLEWIENQNFFIKIPIYQRNYVWTKEIFLNLLNDIINEASRNIAIKKKYHYIGEISFFYNNEEEADFQKKENKNIKLIDGQQRITSLFIIWRILYSYASLNNEKYEIDKFTLNYFKIDETNESNKIIKKFQYIEGNWDLEIFHEIMLGNNVGLGKQKRNSPMYKNFRTGYEMISKKILSKEKFQKIIEVLLNKIAFTGINHINNNEYDLFENLNSNNLALENIDLVKNYILMKLDWNEKKSEIEVLDIFNKYIANPFKNAKKNLLDSFLKAYCKLYQINKSYGKISDNINNNFYEAFKEIIDDELDAVHDGERLMSFSRYQTFLKKIYRSILLFLSITDPPKISKEPFHNIYHISDILNSFGLGTDDNEKKVYYSILMFIIEDHRGPWSPNDNYIEISNLNILRKKLFAIETFEITFKVLDNSGKSLGSYMDRVLEHIKKIYDNNNREISAQEISDTFDILNLTKEYNMNDFEKTLASKSILKPKLIKSLCKRLEFFIDNNYRMDWWDDERNDIGYIKEPDIEYIMPKEMDNWVKDLKLWNEAKNNDEMILDDETLNEEYNKYQNFLGNSIMITKDKSNKLKNNNFVIKQDYYRSKNNFVSNLKQYNGSNKNGFELLSIKELDIWNFDIIKKRSEQMAKIFRAIYTYKWDDNKTNIKKVVE